MRKGGEGKHLETGESRTKNYKNTHTHTTGGDEKKRTRSTLATMSEIKKNQHVGILVRKNIYIYIYICFFQFVFCSPTT